MGRHGKQSGIHFVRRDPPPKTFGFSIVCIACGHAHMDRGGPDDGWVCIACGGPVSRNILQPEGEAND